MNLKSILTTEWFTARGLKMTGTYDQIIQKAIQARQEKNRQQALTLFKEAIVMAPDNFYAYREAGVECRALGLFGEAENLFQQALVHKPNDCAIVIQRAICNRLQGKHELCLQQLMEITDKNTENGGLCYEVAVSLKELGQLKEAEQWFVRALDKSPTNRHFLWQFGLLAKMMGKGELALSQFEAMTEHHPLQTDAYVEVVNQLLELGRHSEAVRKMQLAFGHTKNKSLLEKYLLLLFVQNPQIAVQELFLYADDCPVSNNLMRHFADYILANPQNVIGANVLPKHSIVSLISQKYFASRVMAFKVERFDAFIAILSYFEPVLIMLTESIHQPLMNSKLFLLLVIVAWHKKNHVLATYALAHAEQYIPQFSFDDICKVTLSLEGLTSNRFVLSLYAKAAIEQHSVDFFLACLIMRGYHTEEPSLAMFGNRKNLLKLLPYFCMPKNIAVLKNIFTHLLQKEILTIEDVKTLYPDSKFIDTIKSIDETLKPIFQVNRKRFDKPKKLKVALCVSGQLRGYTEAFLSVKKAIIEPLQPDIFVHTWEDVGFKEPMTAALATRVFEGQFLKAYKDLFLKKNYSYAQIKQKLPTVFSLFEQNASVTEKQLKAFYQTDFVVVEDDKTPPYKEFNNQQKMCYKIDACNRLVQATGKTYDLIIRLRPDRELHPPKHINWHHIAENCNTRKIIFIDTFGHFFREGSGGVYGIGDNVAIGSYETINYYSNILNLNDFFVACQMAHFNTGSLAHSVLAHGLWLGGYENNPLPLNTGKLLGTCLKAKLILQAIQHDLVNLEKDVADTLVNALMQDVVS